MDALEKHRWITLKLIIIQFLGMMVILATGMAYLLFCNKYGHDHDMDRWPLVVSFLIVCFAFISLLFFYRIHTLLIESSEKSSPFQFLKAVVWIDLIALLALVIFTGGLSNSFYSSLLVIVPVVTILIQEEPEFRFTRSLFIASFILITVAALVNWSGIDTLLSDKWGFNPTNRHSLYNLCVFVIMLLGAVMSFVDFLIRYYSKKTNSSGNEVAKAT